MQDKLEKVIEPILDKWFPDDGQHYEAQEMATAILDSLEVDEHDTMIILQTEYNKMTGESLEQDVAFEMARAVVRPRLEVRLPEKNKHEFEIMGEAERGFWVGYAKAIDEIKKSLQEQGIKVKGEQNG